MTFWVQKVTTVSTFPPPKTFTKKAEEVAEIMVRPQVSPLGITSAIRMVSYYINRAGKGLSEARKRELRKAMKLLRERELSPWTSDLPKHCSVCERKLGKTFYVARKKADKQLLVACRKCIDTFEATEVQGYERSGPKKYLALSRDE